MSLDLYKFIPPCIKMASKNLIKSEIYTPALHMKFAYDLLMHFAPELSDSDFLEVYKNYASNDSENIELYNNISTKEPFKILNEIKQLHTTQLFRTKPSTCSSILSDYKMDKCGCCQLCKYSKEYVNSLKDNEYIILSYACASGDIRILSVQNKLELFRYSIPVIKDDNTMCVFPISRLFLDSYLSNYSSNHSQLQTTVNDGVQFEIFYKYLQKKGLKFSDSQLYPDQERILLSSLFDKYLKKKKNLFQHIFCNYRRLFAELKSKINNENLVKSYSSINNVFLGLSSGYLITDISNAKEPLYDVWNNSLIKNNYSNNITFLEGYSIIKISLDIKHSKTRDCIDTALIFRKVIGKAYETGICKLFSLRPLSLNSDSLLFCCMKKDAYNLIDIISHLSKKSYHQVCKDYTIPLFQVELVND